MPVYTQKGGMGSDIRSVHGKAVWKQLLEGCGFMIGPITVEENEYCVSGQKLAKELSTDPTGGDAFCCRSDYGYTDYSLL